MQSALVQTCVWGVHSCARRLCRAEYIRKPFHIPHRTTTILCIRKGNEVVMMGDKRVTLGQSIIAKDSARKLRRAGSYSPTSDTEKKAEGGDDKIVKGSDPSTVLVGFAGSTADAMTLLEKLEAKLNEFPAQLLRAAVELAKEWRGDKMLRRLEASMIVADINETLEIDGSGNVLTPDSSTCSPGTDEGIVAIGSGGQYAKSAARALMKFVRAEEGEATEAQSTSKWTAERICRASMEVAASIDVFTSKQFDMDRLYIPLPPSIVDTNAGAAAEGNTGSTEESTVKAPTEAAISKGKEPKVDTKVTKAKKGEDGKSKSDKKGDEKGKRNGGDAQSEKK